MPNTSADCKKIKKIINHATGRCITKATDKKLRHKQGDFSECASGKTRNTKNRCVAVKTKITTLKKEVAKAKKAQKKADAKVKDNVKKLAQVEKKLKKLTKKGGAGETEKRLNRDMNNYASSSAILAAAARSAAKGIGNKLGVRTPSSQRQSQEVNPNNHGMSTPGMGLRGFFNDFKN